MVKEKKPNIVFLMETKLRSEKMERVRVQLGFEHMFVVDSVGKSGGLALFWAVDIGVEIQNYSRRHISAKVCSSPNKPQWKLTGFYGHPNPSKRKEAWSLLRYIARMDPIPWVCLGDFNEILSADEKYGGSRRQRGLMENFQNTLEVCGLSDLGFWGPKYTWFNGKQGADFTKERLDRAVANGDWCELHHEMEVVVGVTLCSDHLPIFVSIKGRITKPKYPRKFRYEAGWELRAKCRELVASKWDFQQFNDANPWHQLGGKMAECRRVLSRWQHEELERPQRQLAEQSKRLALLYDAENERDVERAIGIQKDLKIFMEQEEIKWRQRAKMDWLKHGDRNSKFFHACASQ
jgi:exonuclease III